MISIVVLLPAPAWSVTMLEVKYHNYHTNFLLNHILNVLSGFIDLTDDYKVEPINKSGFLLCGLGKLAFIGVVTNILVEQIGKRIKN